MPNVQTDLRVTKISVTILATSAPKKPKKQPAKKKPSETSPPTRNQPPTSQCPPTEIPTLPSPTPATIVRRQVTAPTPSPTAPPVAKKPRREPTSQPVIKPPPTRQPFIGEYQVKAVKANYLRTNYTNHTDPNNVTREYRRDGATIPASVQALRPKTGPRHAHYLVNDWVDGSPAPEYHLLIYKDTPEYDHYKRIWQIGEKSPPEETNDWNYFCTTGDILLLCPPEAMS